MQALKSIHEQKVRALMKSINQLQEQVQSLKTQDKEHRRSALIQNIRKSMREQELVIDVLKQTLQEKLPEFKDSKALVNDFVIKKSVGGPLRFRPKTREELENEMDQLNEKYKKVLGSLRQARREANSASLDSSKGDGKQGDDDEAKFAENRFKRGAEEDNGDCSAPPQGVCVLGHFGCIGLALSIAHDGSARAAFLDPALQEEIERLQVEVSSKTITIHAQADEINDLYAELDKLRVYAPVLLGMLRVKLTD